MLLSVAVPLMVFGAVGMALRVPFRALLPAMETPAPLDYSRARLQGFSPLRAAFIEQVLGDVTTASHRAGTFADLESRARGLSQGARPGAQGASPGAPVSVSHALTNDDFDRAYPIPSLPFTASTNTQDASRQQGEPAGCSPIGGTVWYRYTPASDIGLITNTFGTRYRVALAAYAGTDLDDMQQVGCAADDDGNAQIAFAAKSGQTYYFQISGPLGGGDLVFALQPWGRTSRVSVSSGGEEARDHSYRPAVSADGRYVAFVSASTNLVPGYRPCINYRRGWATSSAHPCFHVYVRDRVRGTTEMVSVSSSAVQGDADSFGASISDDGRFVAFISWASNLVDDDSNDVDDVFVHDRVSKTTTRVSVSSAGEQARPPGLDFAWNDKIGNRMSDWVYISGDGRYVAFDSVAPNLVADDTNRTWDVFVRDTRKDTTTRVSVSSSGREADDGSAAQGISADGRVVLFASFADNLVPGQPDDRPCEESDNCVDLYAHDRRTKETSVINVSSSGEWDDWTIQYGAVGGARTISADNRFVVFVSWGSNLVAGDTNDGPDVFVRDRGQGTTRRISLSSSGEQQEFEAPSGDSCIPWCTGALLFGRDLSADGRYIAFASNAHNLTTGAPREAMNVYLRDTLLGTTTLVSVSSRGVAGAGAFVVLSADGRQVFFESGSPNLVEDDTNGVMDVFVHERFRQ